MPCISIVTAVALALIFPILTDLRREFFFFFFFKYHKSITNYTCVHKVSRKYLHIPPQCTFPALTFRARTRGPSPFLNSIFTHTTLKVLNGLWEQACKYIVID